MNSCALANAIACRLDNDELALLSSVPVQPGAIATQRGLCEKPCDKK